MANRNTLHKTKIDEFKSFIKWLGYKEEKPKGQFEVMRFKIPGHPVGIVFNGKSPEHYSLNNAAAFFMGRFNNKEHLKANQR